MRFMIIVKATKDSEAGVMPDEKLLAEMAAYHEDLAKAGILLDGSGLKPSSEGWRIQYDGAVRGDERAGRRLHPHPDEDAGGGVGMDEALPQSGHRRKGR
jgi:hypothetical protein